MTSFLPPAVMQNSHANRQAESDMVKAVKKLQELRNGESDINTTINDAATTVVLIREAIEKGNKSLAEIDKELLLAAGEHDKRVAWLKDARRLERGLKEKMTD